MSRNATSEVDERAHALLGTDEHDFWDRPTDLDEPLVIAEEDPTIDGEHETRVYMGQVRHTQADRDELDALEHDDCRVALRAARLLRRYP